MRRAGSRGKAALFLLALLLAAAAAPVVAMAAAVDAVADRPAEDRGLHATAGDEAELVTEAALSGEGTLPFLEGYFLWRDPMAAAIIIGAMCGFLGIYVVLRRIVFMAAALGQISSVGVAVAFWVAGLTCAADHGHAAGAGPDPCPWYLNPILVSLIFVILSAIALSLQARFRRITEEGVIGFAYLLAAGLVVLVGDMIPEGGHHISDLLFGSAVAVPTEHVYILVGTCFALLLLHIVFFKEFVFISFDSDMARALGLPVRLFDILLFVSVGILIAEATRAIGALPVFAFMVLPPLAALLLTQRLERAFVLSTVLGVVAGAGGYYLSWVLVLPTGATMAVLAALLLAPGAVARLARRG